MSQSTPTSLQGRKVILHDMCLRDGMHAKREQISVAQMVKVATALDDAGVPYIQVTHGGGLGGNSLQHGFAPHSNEEYISAVAPLMRQAKISVLLIPGLGTMAELHSAYDWRAQRARGYPLHRGGHLAPAYCLCAQAGHGHHRFSDDGAPQ